jgi:quinol monooxygenase YgiN
MKNLRTFVAVMALALPGVLLQSALAQAAGGEVTVVSLMDIVPNAYIPKNEDNAQALFKQYLPTVNGEAGLVSINVLRETMRGNHFAMVEVWASMADFDKHSNADNTKKFRTTLQPMLGSPWDQRVMK